jgi:hypothetical protein
MRSAPDKRRVKDDEDLPPWTEVKSFYGPDHPRGKAQVVVSKRRDNEYSFAAGFDNAGTFRVQRHFPGNRLGEIIDLMDEALDAYPPTGRVAQLNRE